MTFAGMLEQEQKRGIALRSLLVWGAAALLLAVGHVAALANSWYWRWWWYDWVMHFWGGFTVGGLAAWGWRWVAWGPHRWFRWGVGTTIALTLGGAMIGWELLEYVIGVQSEWEPYPLDTTIDVLMGSMGGCAAWWIVRRNIAPKRGGNATGNSAP